MVLSDFSMFRTFGASETSLFLPCWCLVLGQSWDTLMYAYSRCGYGMLIYRMVVSTTTPLSPVSMIVMDYPKDLKFWRTLK